MASTRLTRSTAAFLAVAALGVLAAPARAEEAKASSASSSKEDKYAAKRAKIDKEAKRALDKLLHSSASAKTLYDKAYGYAVFEARKTSFAVAGGGGKGVAVAKASRERTYMKMASIGLNFGIGVKFYDVVFLFEDESSFERFVDKGWEAGADANAVGGTEGANASASFINGMAIYQLNDKGLMLSADISGTKYWKPENLNEL